MSEKPLFNDTIVRQLAQILKDTDLTEIEYALGECRIRVARQPIIHTSSHVAIPAPGTSAPAMTSSSAEGLSSSGVSPDYTKHPGAIKAPMVGTVYRSASPGDAPFVEVGMTVKKDQTVLIIEAMKVMNQIRAHQSGVVTQILCRDAEPVEYGHVLLVIE